MLMKKGDLLNEKETKQHAATVETKKIYKEKNKDMATYHGCGL
jgi:hypothetical protein